MNTIQQIIQEIVVLLEKLDEHELRYILSFIKKMFGSR